MSDVLRLSQHPWVISSFTLNFTLLIQRVGSCSLQNTTEDCKCRPKALPRPVTPVIVILSPGTVLSLLPHWFWLAQCFSNLFGLLPPFQLKKSSAPYPPKKIIFTFITHRCNETFKLKIFKLFIEIHCCKIHSTNKKNNE